MTYIIMAIQEEGSETRVSDLDEHARGFNTEGHAYHALHQLRDDYPEYQRLWIEELHDKEYWYWRELERYAQGEDYYDD